MWRFWKKTKPTSRRPSRLARGRKRLEVESLEDRRVLSWGSVPPAVIVPPADAEAVALNPQADAQGFASIDRDEIDYYTFVAPASGSYDFAAQAYSSSIDTVMAVYNAGGQRLAYNDDIIPGLITDSQLSVNLQAGQRYYFGVTNYIGSGGGSYLWSVDGPAADDSYEDNDGWDQASNLGTLSGRQTITGLVMADSADWFRFTMPGPGSSAHYVSINFQHSQGDLDMVLYDAQGGVVGTSDGVTDLERISLNGRAAGTYYVHVYGFLGAFNPNYTLDINPGVVVTPTDDGYEENDTLAQASDLGPVTATRTIPGLVMADSADWFRFTTNQAGSSSSAVTIRFQQAQGNLDLRLYDSSGTQLRSSEGTGDSERISLDGLAAGTYHVQVYGYQGAHNPNYTLEINPGTGTPGGGGSHTLYMVFDGATITRGELLRWSADWSADARVWRDEYLDAEGDGIQVQPYLAGRGDREPIINRIIELMQDDVRAFGITVVRHSGPVVEGVGATTLYVGPAALSSSGFAGIACDIDFGNDNATDIAFALEQPAWFGVEDTARVMADLGLHEAGHTWGLYHVDSPFTNEAMGLGYSFGTYLGVNAEFRNESFPEYLDHGYGRGPQNSYQVMSRQFVSGEGLAGPDGYGGLAGGYHLDSFDVAGGAIYLGGHDGHGHHDHHGGAMSPHVHEEELGQKAKGEEHHHAVEEGHEHAVPSGLSEHHRQEKFGGPAVSLSGSPSPLKFDFGNAVDALFAQGKFGGPAVSLSDSRSPVKSGGPAVSLSGSPSPVRFGFGNVVDALRRRRGKSLSRREWSGAELPGEQANVGFSEGESVRPGRANDTDLLLESIPDRLTTLW